MSLDVYSYDAHLSEEDRELFTFADVSWLRAHRLARQDLERDLLRRGFDGISHPSIDNLLDEFATATVTLSFTAGAGGSLVVPLGATIRTIATATQTNGGVEFTTDVALTVGAGLTGTVAATAAAYGEPYNVAIGTLINYSGTAPTNFSSVTNLAAASGGHDHQLTRASVYRAMDLVYTDLMRGVDDRFGQQRLVYGLRYKEELERMYAAGLRGSVTDLAQNIGLRSFGRVRLERG